jgi:D-alanyl-D-alanine carboxypeptidase
MSANGNLPTSELSPIPGGQLRNAAAVAWLAMRAAIGKSQNVWICPTSPRTSYRPLADQEYFWKQYQAGKGALAARPGTSNHGWGIAVDLPTEPMQAAVRAHGHEYGWGIRGGGLGSDAPSEAWHCTFHEGVFKAPPRHDGHVHPYLHMSDKERAARDVLIKQRRVAKRHGGWSKVDPSHLRAAVKAKNELRQYARDIAAAAKDTGWDKNNRKARFDYINKLTGVSHG